MSNEESKFEAHFDHTGAYEEGGPMHEAIHSLMELASEHGVPILVIACTKSDDEDTQIKCYGADRPGYGLPQLMASTYEFIHLNNQEINLITAIMGLMRLARQNVSELSDDIVNIIKGAKNASKTDEH